MKNIYEANSNQKFIILSLGGESIARTDRSWVFPFPQVNQALVKQFLPSWQQSTLVEELPKWLFFPFVCWKQEGIFPLFTVETCELLEGELTKLWGSTVTGSPGVCNSQSCLHGASNSSSGFSTMAPAPEAVPTCESLPQKVVILCLPVPPILRFA